METCSEKIINAVRKLRTKTKRMIGTSAGVQIVRVLTTLGNTCSDREFIQTLNRLIKEEVVLVTTYTWRFTKTHGFNGSFEIIERISFKTPIHSRNWKLGKDGKLRPGGDQRAHVKCYTRTMIHIIADGLSVQAHQAYRRKCLAKHSGLRTK